MSCFLWRRRRCTGHCHPYNMSIEFACRDYFPIIKVDAYPIPPSSQQPNKVTTPVPEDVGQKASQPTSQRRFTQCVGIQLLMAPAPPTTRVITV